MWVIGFPLSFVLRHRPEQYGLLPDGDSQRETDPSQTASMKNDGAGEPMAELQKQTTSTELFFTAREALKTRNFWVLSVGTSVSFMAMSALFVHIMPFLESIGISREKAGLVVTFTILFSVLGRIGLGWLSDYIDRRHAFAIAIGLQVIGLFIFANIQNLWHVIPFLLTFSPGYGAPIPLRPAIQGEYFGRKHFGAIQGFFMSVSTVSAMIFHQRVLSDCQFCRRCIVCLYLL
jgi:sugar phosphate permease